MTAVEIVETWVVDENILFIVLDLLTTKENIVELNDVPVACKMGPLAEEISEGESRNVEEPAVGDFACLESAGH